MKKKCASEPVLNSPCMESVKDGVNEEIEENHSILCNAKFSEIKFIKCYTLWLLHGKPP
jgi:hypothetical protein